MKFASNLLKHKILNAPLTPGCYIYRNDVGIILYIGKASVLRDRVKNYFSQYHDLELRIKNMVDQIRDVEYVQADNDEEAFILETNLIKKYKPKYNVSKKDDKSYSWIKIDRRTDFPVIELVREKDKRQSRVLYFGPYQQTYIINRVLRKVRKSINYRTCTRKITVLKDKDGKEYIKSSNSKPCLFYHIGLCKAPCAGLTTRKEYRSGIRELVLFLNKSALKLVRGIKKEMYKAAMEKKFEKAASLRDKMQDLIYLMQKIDVDIGTDEKKFKEIKEKKKKEAVEGFKEFLNIRYHPGFRMECYDISNIQGKYATGSMVVFTNLEPDKKMYRKFRIKFKKTPDDFAMLEEVFKRRFKKRDKTLQKSATKDISFASTPDLIVVDGGKGQLSKASKVLLSLGITIPIIGLAKRFEEIIALSKTGGEMHFTSRRLPVASSFSQVIQRIRDESHRFAVSYHRKLRLKAQAKSILSSIPGVGKILEKKLLISFGTVEKIKSANMNELTQVVKNSSTVKKIIKQLK